MPEQVDVRESWVALGDTFCFVIMIYPITIIAKGTMGYPLCDMVDAVDLAGPTGECLRSNEQTGESWVALGHMLVCFVVMIYPSTIISQGTMSYPLCDPVDAVDLASPIGQCLRSNEQTRENIG